MTTITVYVRDSSKDLTLLSKLGDPGLFSATFVTDPRHQRRTGEVLFLYADLTPPFSLGPRMIRGYLGMGIIPMALDLHSDWHLITPGIAVREIVHPLHPRRLWRPAPSQQHRVDVQIRPDLPLGKVWLARRPLHLGFPDASQKADVFRRGQIHQTQERWLFG